MQQFSLSDRPDASTSSGSANPAITRDKVMGASATDCSPSESTICEDLTAELASFLREDDGGVVPAELHETDYFRTRTFEEALFQAAVAIQYNAKWFSPPDLAALIQTALHVVSSSSSSAAVYATLGLFDTVVIYSCLPTEECLMPVARFFCRTYCNASRAHKHRDLAAKTWSVMLHILQSHLGSQLLAALFEVMESDLQARPSFSQTAGAIMLVTEVLRSTETLPSVNAGMLVLKLESSSTDDNIKHHIIELLTEIVDNEPLLEQISNDAGWDALLRTAQRCIEPLPEAETSQALVTRLEARIPRIPSDGIRGVAALCTLAGRPLPDQVSHAIIGPWSAMSENDQLTAGFVHNLGLLTQQEEISPEVAALVQRSIDTCLLKVSANGGLRDSLAHIATLIKQARSPEVMSVFVRPLIGLMEQLIAAESPQDELQMVLDTLCETAGTNPDAAAFLFRLRSDVTGKCYLEAVEDGLSSAQVQIHPIVNIDKWYDRIVESFSVEAKDTQTWEVFSCFLQKTRTALGNHALFARNPEFLNSLRNAICGYLDHGDYMDPPPYTGLTKSHVVADLIETLTALLSYHKHQSKKATLTLVDTFIKTAGSRDYVVSIACVHALSICCYDVPELMGSYLALIIDKMSRMVTQRFVAIHVLQFLAGLSRRPELIKDFATADFKMIFGVCFSFLQSTRGVTATPVRNRTPTSEASSTTRNEEALPEYVYALAHHIVAFWYMAMKSQDRAALKEYIETSLTYEQNGVIKVEDQGLVTIDMMERTDIEDNHAHAIVEAESDKYMILKRQGGSTVSSKRIIGLQIVTTETLLRTGLTYLTARRPSGTTTFVIQPQRTSSTSHPQQIPIQQNEEDATFGFIPPGLIHLASTAALPQITPLPNDPPVPRALESFDRTSALDSPKPASST